MQVYQCDFCNTIKACTQITIDCKKHDICAACKAELDKKLEGKGVTVLPRFGRRWNDWHFQIVQPVYVPYVPPPTVAPWSPIYTPKIDWGTTSGQWSTSNSSVVTITDTTVCGALQ
jgi:hypothetical protein